MHPVMGKWLLEQFSPIQVAGLRYISALLAYGIFTGVVSWIRFRKADQFLNSSDLFFAAPNSWNHRILLFILGFMAFCFSPLIQNLGLAQSMASENALIVAIEPVVTVALAWL